MLRSFVSLMIASLAAGGAVSKPPAEKAPTTETQPAATKLAVYDSVSVAAGAKLFKQYCLPCHGKNGEGNGPVGAALKPRPRNFHKAEDLKSKNDEDLFKVISNGGPALGLSPLMVGWKTTLKEPQIRQLIAYVRSFAASDTSGAPSKTKSGGDAKPNKAKKANE